MQRSEKPEMFSANRYIVQHHTYWHLTDLNMKASRLGRKIKFRRKGNSGQSVRDPMRQLLYQ